jgi:hypothetical protein
MVAAIAGASPAVAERIRPAPVLEPGGLRFGSDGSESCCSTSAIVKADERRITQSAIY